MRRNAMYLMAAVAFAGLLSAAGAAEKGYSPVAYEEGTYVSNEIAGLRAEIESLREQMDGNVTTGYDQGPKGAKADGYDPCCCDPCCGCCDSCCGGCCDSCCGGCGCCCDPCCRSQGLYMGAEAVWLKPHHNAGVGSFAVASGAGPGVEPEYDVTPRIWIGWQRCDGLGFRTRYWEFDHDYRGTIGANPVFHGWDTWVWDLEMTDSTKLGCNWDATFFGGFRYIDYYENNGLGVAPFVGVGQGRADTVFSGFGPTAGLELRRQLTCTLGVFTNLRWSIIMGDENDGNVGGVTPGVFEFDNIRMMYEFQSGAEYIAPICCNAYYYIRGGVEVQYWDGFGSSGFTNGPGGRLGFEQNPAVGFGGFMLSAGLQR